MQITCLREGGGFAEWRACQQTGRAIAREYRSKSTTAELPIGGSECAGQQAVADGLQLKLRASRAAPLIVKLATGAAARLRRLCLRRPRRHGGMPR